MFKQTLPIIIAGALSLCLLQALPAQAKVTVFENPRRVVYDTAGLSAEQIAMTFLSENADLYSAGSIEELRWHKTFRMENITYVRFQQVHQSIPVEGAEVVLTLDGEGRAVMLSDSSVPSNLIPDAGQCISRQKAEGTVFFSRADILIDGARGPLYIPAWEEAGGAFLVRAVRVKRIHPLGLWEVYVDCAEGSIVGYMDLMVRADGKVYDPNPIVNPVVQTVTLNNLTSTTNLEGSLAVSYACADSACDSMTQRAVADGDGNFLYDPDEPSLTDPFSEVNGYYHVDKINTWFETELDYVYTCEANRFMKIVVNLDEMNGYYMDIDGDRCGDIVIGQVMTGAGCDLAYDGEVIYHEFSHAVIMDTMGWSRIRTDELGHDYTLDGVSEGFADYYAMSLTDNPRLGEYGLVYAFGSSRTAENDMVCPDNITGEGHADGQLWSGTLWDIRTALDAQKADALSLATLYAISRGDTLSNIGDAFIAQAHALEGTALDPGDATVVEDAVAARQLPGCRRIIFLEDGENAACFAEGSYGGWGPDFFTCGVQFAVEAPPGTRRVALSLLALSMSVDYDVYIKHDTNVRYTSDRLDVTPVDYDYVISGSPGSVAWTEWSDPPVSPGTTYYISIHNNGSDALLLSVDTSVLVSPVDDSAPDAVDAVEDTTADEAEPADMVEDAPQDPVEDLVTDTTQDTQEDPSDDIEEETEEDGGKDGCGCSVIS